MFVLPSFTITFQVPAEAGLRRDPETVRFVVHGDDKLDALCSTLRANGVYSYNVEAGDYRQKQREAAIADETRAAQGERAHT